MIFKGYSNLKQITQAFLFSPLPNSQSFSFGSSSLLLDLENWEDSRLFSELKPTIGCCCRGLGKIFGDLVLIYKLPKNIDHSPEVVG